MTAVGEWGEDSRKWVITKSAFMPKWMTWPPNDDEPGMWSTFADACRMVAQSIDRLDAIDALEAAVGMKP